MEARQANKSRFAVLRFFINFNLALLKRDRLTRLLWGTLEIATQRSRVFLEKFIAFSAQWATMGMQIRWKGFAAKICHFEIAFLSSLGRGTLVARFAEI